jgi:hypothetical protein
MVLYATIASVKCTGRNICSIKANQLCARQFGHICLTCLCCFSLTVYTIPQMVSNYYPKKKNNSQKRNYNNTVDSIQKEMNWAAMV